MARDDDRDRVQDALATMGAERFVRALRIDKVQRTGRGVRVPCPVHNGSDPNCDVADRDGRIVFVCHSACGGQGGDALDFIAAVHGLDARAHFRDVLELGARLGGITLDELGRSPEAERRAREHRQKVADLEAERRRREDQEHAERCDVFAALWERLDLHGAAVPYLAGRGLSHPRHGFAAATGFGVRYLAPDDAPAVLGELAERFGADVLERIGLTDSQGRSRFDRHPLLFPAHDAEGRLGWFQGRAVADVPKAERWTSPKGSGSSGRCLYGARGLTEPGVVLLCEGPTDVLALVVHAAEIAAELASPFVAVGKVGTGALSTAQAAMMRDRRVLIAYDADAAGQSGVTRAAPTLHRAGARDVRRLPVPDELDVGEWVQKRRAAWFGGDT